MTSSTQNPDFNFNDYLWDELEQRLLARIYYPTPNPDLSNAPLAEWKNPTGMLQKLVEILLGKVEVYYYSDERTKIYNGTTNLGVMVESMGHTFVHMVRASLIETF